MSNLGLHRVATDELKRLLRALHRGVLPSPITRSALIEKTFGHVEGHLDALVGREVETAKAVIVAVLGERAASHGARVQLSYLGVAAPGTLSRDLREQTRELLSSATRSVELYGLDPALDRGLLRSVAAVREGRDVETRLVFDASGAEALAAVRSVLERNFRDRERLEAFVGNQHRIRMRAVIIDRRLALVTSGELAGTEEDHHVDLGVLLEDAAYIEAWHKEWARLLDAGAVQAISPA